MSVMCGSKRVTSEVLLALKTPPRFALLVVSAGRTTRLAVSTGGESPEPEPPQAARKRAAAEDPAPTIARRLVK
jgi:hypothetical protein